MRFLITMVFTLSLVAGLSACSSGTSGDNSDQAQTQEQTKAQTQAGQSNDLKTQKDKFSYAVGMDIGHSMQRFKDKIEPDKLIDGLQDSLEGGKTELTKKQKTQIIQAYVKKIRAQKKKEAKAEASKNAKQSKQYLAKNKKKDGVKVTDDGLQYQVLQKGDGPSPSADDVVVVKYKGTLPDGSVFDSSYKRNKPATFPVKNVIPGWTEALQLMHVGGKYRLVIPPQLAYGRKGAGSKIGPNQVLIFKVELVDIKNENAGKAADHGEKKETSSTEDKHSSSKG